MPRRVNNVCWRQYTYITRVWIIDRVGRTKEGARASKDLKSDAGRIRREMKCCWVFYFCAVAAKKKISSYCRQQLTCNL